MQLQEMKNPHPCPYNGGVVCVDQIGCIRCGWNPKVAEERLHRIMEEQKKRGNKNGKYYEGLSAGGSA